MIVNNTASAIGDILYVYSQGLLSGSSLIITGFTDITVGETLISFWTKAFRYSLDGLNFSDWLPLTNPNLSTITGEPDGLIFFEFSYMRDGTDTTGVLEFQNITLTGTITIQIVNNTATLGTIFEELATNDALTREVCQNLLEKIYYSGIIPKFIERNDGDDRDYIDFWAAVCFYFAMLISFMNKFDFILFEKDYLAEYLKQKGIFFNSENLFVELQFLANNFLDEIRKRGTKQIWLKKGVTLLDGSVTEIDGEWLRLLARNQWDEFLVENILSINSGFNIGNSWPTYNGTHFSRQLNKTKENQESFQSLSNYSLLNPTSVSLVNDSGVIVMRLFSDIVKTGIGYDVDNPPFGVLPSEDIIVDDEVDYEITFSIRRARSSFIGFDDLVFGVLGFNHNDVFKYNAFQQIDNAGAFTTKFFEDTTFRCTKGASYYFVRGIIYNKNANPITDPDFQTLNNKMGLNLKFNPLEKISKILPCLYTSAPGGSNTDYFIKDFKVRPLVRGKFVNDNGDSISPYIINPQFVQVGNIIQSWMKNNNEQISNDALEEEIQDKLIPYNTKLIPVFLSQEIDDKQVLTY